MFRGLPPGDADAQVALGTSRRDVPTIIRRSRPFRPRDLAIVALVALFGVGIGLFLRFTDSLPQDQRSIGTIVFVLAAIGVFVSVLTGMMQWVGGWRLPLLATVAFVAAAFVAYPFGPGVPPPVTVAGTYALTLSGIQGVVEGEAACNWDAGRARIGELRVPVPHPAGEARLTVYFSGARTTIETPRASYRWTGPESILAIDGSAPAVSPDASSGAIRIYVVRTDLDALDDGEPAELSGTLRWQCQAAPPA